MTTKVGTKANAYWLLGVGPSSETELKMGTEFSVSTSRKRSLVNRRANFKRACSVWRRGIMEGAHARVLLNLAELNPKISSTGFR